MKMKVIAVVHLTPNMNVGNSEIITLKNGESTRFNDNNQFWFYALGSNLMKQFSTKLDFEIWQPDSKTNEILVRKYNNGLVYKLFPGNYTNELTITGSKNRLHSQILMESIESEVAQNSRLALFFRGTNEYLLNRLVKKFYGRVPFVGMFSISISGELKIDHFWKYPLQETFHYFFGLRPYKKFLKKVHNIVPSTQEDIKALKFFKELKVFYRDDFASWGIDTDFWQKSGDPDATKEEYGIKKDEKVILISSRMVKEKQVKEMIIVLGSFNNENFKLIITGNIGNNNYAKKVTSLAQKLLPGKVIMPGYVSDEELRNLYSISDLMLSYSVSEGGPFSIFQAYLMEVPVIQSSVGTAGEIAKSQGVSKLVNPFQIEKIRADLKDFFYGNIPKILDRDIAVSYFDWKRIVMYYFTIFEKVITNFKNK